MTTTDYWTPTWRCSRWWSWRCCWRWRAGCCSESERSPPGRGAEMFQMKLGFQMVCGVWATANTNTALALSLRWMKPCKTCQYQLEKRFSIIKLKGNWTIVAAVFISVFWRELNWLVWRGRKQVHIKDPDIYEENVWHNRIKKIIWLYFLFPKLTNHQSESFPQKYLKLFNKINKVNTDFASGL